MKKTNLVLATLLASVVGLGSTAAIADNHGDGERSWKHHSGEHKSGKHGMRGGKHGKRGGRHGGGKHMMKRMAKKLGLSDDQQAQIKTFRESQRTANQALYQEMKDQREAMQKLDRSDAAAVTLMATAKGELAQKMFIARNDSRLAFETFLDGILTAEQKTKMAEMKAKREARKLERQQKRMERKAAKDAS